jgi:hypothetical protein
MADQLLVFIDPIKFGHLVGEDTIPGYRVRENHGDGVAYNYLNNSHSLVYFKDDTTSDVGPFNHPSAEAASLLLIPDTLPPNEFGYVPGKRFKILFHAGPGSANKIEGLKANPFFRGVLKSAESSNTPYADLASAILRKSSAAIAGISERIPEFDPVLEAKLELLQAILNSQKPTDEALVLLRKKLPAFDQNFEAFVQADQTDIFSPLFQTAFDNFRDALDLD